MRKASLGEQELELLKFVTEHAPIALSDVVEHYGTAHGLARTTIHTVLERLRKKGYLVREKRDGVYQYQTRLDQAELMTGMVDDFIQRMLKGSLKPFVAYLSASSQDLSDDEVQALKALVQDLEAQRKEGRDAE